MFACIKFAYIKNVGNTFLWHIYKQVFTIGVSFFIPISNSSYSETFNFLKFTFSPWDVFLGTLDKHIAFQAMINDDVLANGNVIVYDQVNTNLGQGYNSTSLIFTIPRDGVYIFTWSMRSHPHARK